MTEPDTSGDEANPPFKVLAVTKQDAEEPLTGAASELPPIGTASELPPTIGATSPPTVTGVLGAPGVPDEDPAEALPDLQGMSNDELLAEATAHNTRADEETPHA